nr:hypothetical protein Iba_chr05aCG10800 [Ipomoea batatas]
MLGSKKGSIGDALLSGGLSQGGQANVGWLGLAMALLSHIWTYRARSRLGSAKPGSIEFSLGLDIFQVDPQQTSCGGPELVVATTSCGGPELVVATTSCGTLELCRLLHYWQ